MASTTVWNQQYVGTAVQTMSWSVPSGCTADSLTVYTVNYNCTYLYWRDGQWNLRSGKSNTYTVSGTSGSEVFFAGGSGGGYCYVTVTLNYHTVEAASTISASNISLGGTSTVTISNSSMASSSIRHVVTWTAGNYSQTKNVAAGTMSTTQVIDSNFAAQYASTKYVNNVFSFTVTVSCKTYYNGTTTQIGSTATTSFTVSHTKTNNDNPVGSFTFAAVNQKSLTQGTTTYTYNLTGITSVKITGGFSTSYSAIISAIKITGPGINISTTVDALASGVTVKPTGSGTIKVDFTDSRGLTGSSTSSSFTFTNYSAPSISTTAYRSSSNGVRADDGVYVSAKSTFSYTSLGGNNSATVSYYQRRDNSSSYTNTGISSSTSGETKVLGNGYDVTYQYYIKAVVADKFGYTAETVVFVGTAAVFMRWDYSKKAFGFGAYPSSSNSVHINADWDLYLHGLEVSKYIGNLIYPIGSIYISTNSTSPATIYGGSWTQLKDRFLLAAGDSYSAGSTGGESSHALTVSELPSHDHGTVSSSYSTTGVINPLVWDKQQSTNGIVTSVTRPYGLDRTAESGADFSTTQITLNVNHKHNSVGSGTAHNNMPPYLAVYVWKRTALATQ